MTAVLQPRPSLSAPAPWHFPRVAEHQLPNGLRVVAVNLPGKRVATASMVLDMPLDTDPSGLEGLAVLAARCLSKGTTSLDAEDFSRALERQGATFNAGAGFDGLTATLDVPVSRLSTALPLLADAVMAPLFAADEIDRLQKQRLAEIPQERTSPPSRCALEFNALLYADSSRESVPSGGTRETVTALTAAAVTEGYATRVAASTSILLLAGDLTGVDVPTLVDDAFGSWDAEAPRWERIAPTLRASGRALVVDRPGSVQTQLLLGHPALGRTSPQWPAAALAAYAMGGTLTSRIDAVLREEKGYTYGVRAQISPNRLRGTFSISGSVDTGNTEPALQDLMAILDGALTDGLREDELVAAREFLVGVSPMRWETPSAVVGALTGLVANGLPPGWIDGNLAGMRTAQLDDLNTALRSEIRPDDMLAVLVGEASSIVQPLEDLGFGTAIVVPA